MAMNKIFRQTALDKLATPEELDKMIKVTDPKGWIALLGLLAVVVAAVVWGILGSIPTITRGTGILIRQDGIQEIRAAGPGQITEINIRTGDPVKEGQVIARVNGAQGQVEIKSPFTGNVLEVLAEKDMAVQDSAIARIEQTNKPLQGVMYVPVVDGKRLKLGLPVQLTPTNVRAEDHGFMVGKIIGISQFPVSAESQLLVLKNQQLVQGLLSSGPALRVDVLLEPDPTSPSTFKWSSPPGPKVSITSGTLFSANMVLGEQRPISLILPVFRDEGN